MPNPLSELRGDFAYAIRRLRHAPAFAAVVIGTVALGAGATTTVFSIVNAVLLRPVPVLDADRVVRIYETNPASEPWLTSEPDYLDVRDRTHSFTSVAAVTDRGASLLGRGDPVALSGYAATASYFALFGGRPIAGSVYDSQNDRPGGDTHVIVISEAIWRRVFAADRRALGTYVSLDGVPYRLVGVMPDGYGYLPAAFWVPLAPSATSMRANRVDAVFGRLKPGVMLAQAETDVRAVAAELARAYPQSNARWGARLQSLSSSIVGPELPRELVLLLAAVGALMLLACANVANLLLARGSARTTEMAVRSALGAEAGRIARQLLTESLVVSAAGGIGGIGVTLVAIALLRRIIGANVPRLHEASVDGRVLAIAAGVAVLTGLLFGVAPALHAARSDLQSTLRAGARTVAGGGRRVRDGLVAVEVALAMVLLVGAGLLGRSLARLQRVPLGFDTSVLQLTVSAPNEMPRGQRAGFFHQIETAIGSAPGVASTGASSVAPFGGVNHSSEIIAEGHDLQPSEYVAADWRSVTPGVFRTLGIGLVRGRLFDDADMAGRPNVGVIDETMAARLWPGQSPLGKHVMAAQSARGPDDQLEVVGVVRAVRDQSAGGAPRPTVYFPESQKPWTQLTFFVKGNAGVSRGALADAIRRAVRTSVPNTPVPEISALESNVERALAPQRFTTRLLGGFAAAALFLAALGLYGVIAYSVQQRLPELGVRLAFGATPLRIALTVMRDAGALVAMGAAAGAVAAAGLTRLITSQLFATDPGDAATYASSLLVLLGVAVVASYLPARRAARTDPLVALRER